MVIDVLRAFTTTAYAFARGAKEIQLVSTVEHAFAIRQNYPETLLMGEVNGYPIDGFDLPNSPTFIDRLDLTDKSIVLRTTAGTQGAVLATQAETMYVASLNVATATACSIKRLNPKAVTFIETGIREKGGGEEDIACADYIASLLIDDPLNPEQILTRVTKSKAAIKFSDSSNEHFLQTDLKYALNLDCFSFAMKVIKNDNSLILKPTSY